MNDPSLSTYSAELLRDVAEAKRHGGRAILHLWGDRIRRAVVREAAAQLLPFGVFVTTTEPGVLVEWGRKGEGRLAQECGVGRRQVAKKEGHR